MGRVLILLVVALVAAALVFGVVSLITGSDQGLQPAEPDGQAIPLPVVRPLTEGDITAVRFDTVARGYRMAQVDQALRRAAYDIGYKEELINVLEAEVVALREGRVEDAEALRAARETAARPAAQDPDGAEGTDTDGGMLDLAVEPEPSNGARPGLAATEPVAAESAAAEPTAAKSTAAKSTDADPALADPAEPVADEDDDARDTDPSATGPREVSVASGQPGAAADAQQ